MTRDLHTDVQLIQLQLHSVMQLEQGVIPQAGA